MSDFEEKLILVIISFLGGSISQFFIYSWWKQPKLLLKINHNRNHTFFLKSVDPDSKLKGEIKLLPEIFIQIEISIYNLGGETEILNAQLKYKNNIKYSNWYSFIDHKGGILYYINQDFAIGTNKSMLGKDKHVEVSKIYNQEGYLYFKIPLEGIPDYIESRIKITPLKGWPKTSSFKIYEYQPC